MNSFFKQLLAVAFFMMIAGNSLGNDPVVGNISGRLLNPAGSGVSGVEIVLVGANAADRHTSITQPDGAFSFTVPAGNWFFNISRDQPQIANFIPQTFRFPVFESTNFTNVEAKLIAQDAVITGSVRGPDGQPVTGIGVTAWRIENGDVTYALEPTTTDSAGNFTLTASKGPWFVFLDCGTLGTRTFDCDQSENVDASSGAATVNFSLTAALAPTIESPRIQFNAIGNTGSFEAILFFTLRGEPGTYDILARNDVPRVDYTWPEVDSVIIPEGATSVEVRHVLNSIPSMPTAQFFKVRRR